MNKHFHFGLRFRMTLLFSIVFLCINILFGRVIYQYFKNSYIENYNKYLYSQAQRILDKTEVNPDIIALPDSGVAIRIFYHDSENKMIPVFQSPGSIAKLNVPFKTGLVDSLGQYGVYLKKENFDGRPVELLLTVSDFSLKNRVKQFTLLVVFVTVISLAVSSIFSYLASGWLLRPIRRIAHEASAINTERLGHRIRVTKTHDELQKLGETINEMIVRIEKEQQVRNQFFAAASHELRTPLANLRAQTELELSSRTYETDEQLLNSQLSEITRLQSIVDQFLLISEFNQNGITLRKIEVDVSDQLMQVFSKNAILALKQGIKYNLNFSKDAKSFTTFADKNKLEVVWQNLLQNAIKYSRPGGILICVVKQLDNHLQVSFQNSIVQESIDVSELGKPFSRGWTVSSGSGLGLWLCKEILDAHAGKIRLESNSNYFRVTVLLEI